MKRILSILVLLTGMAIQGHAQTKLGHIYPQLVLEGYPEYEKLQKKVQEKGEEAYSQLGRMDSIYQDAIKIYTRLNKDPNASDIDLLEAEEDVRNMQQRIEEQTQIKQQELQNFQEKGLTSVMKNVRGAIDSVSKAGNYTYVLDATGILYVGADSKDLTNEVRVILGLPEVDTSTANNLGVSPQ